MKKPIFVRSFQPADESEVRKLWTNYLTWGNSQMQLHYGNHPHEPNETVNHDFENIVRFLPPNGSLMLAFLNDKPFATGSLNKLDHDRAVIKRVFVEPDFRSLGGGRAIVTALLDQAKKNQYKKVVLDSPMFMTAAHSLYKSFGFKECGPFVEVEMPKEYWKHLCFMEIDL